MGKVRIQIAYTTFEKIDMSIQMLLYQLGRITPKDIFRKIWCG